MNKNKSVTKSRSPGRNISGAMLILFAPLIFLSCLPGDSSEGPLSSETLEVEIFNVRAAEASIGDIEDRVSLSGEVYATGRVNVVPDTGGLLTKVLVNPGDSVGYNQIVAYVDPSRPGMAYAESPVRSKSSGTVTAVSAIAGNQVSAQSVIAEVGNLDRLEVDIKVPEKYLGSLKTGLQGWISSRAFPDSEQSARVTEVSPVVDPRSRTVMVTMVPDSTDTLRPGQAVTVNLVLETRKNILTVPSSAVTQRRDGNGVFIVDGEKASWKPVTIGTNVAGYIEIVDGLNTGDTVITAGFKELTDGSLIRVLEN